MTVANPRVAGHEFLSALYGDDYFPDPVVDKGVAILVRLAERIEADNPADLIALYALTHASTEEFNLLAEDFEDAGSEIETVAREEIAEDFGFIASAYGFTGADIEELIAPRDW